MLEKFTQRTRNVIERAQEEALSFSHSHLGTAHLLLGLSGERASVAASVLRRLGVEYDEAREQVESVEGYGMGSPGDRARFTPRAKKALEVAMRESLQKGDGYMRTDHLLLGLLGEREGISARVLLNLGADPDEALREAREILRTRTTDEDDPMDRAP